MVIRFHVDPANLPEFYPTHTCPSNFWEKLGRCVATFGFLEDCLSRATFAITATQKFSSWRKAESAYAQWARKMAKVQSAELSTRAKSFIQSCREYHEPVISNLQEFESDMAKIVDWRNLLCHGSYGSLSDAKVCRVAFVPKGSKPLSKEISDELLEEVQFATAKMCISIINSITFLGFQFRGSGGPGLAIIGVGPPQKKL